MNHNKELINNCLEVEDLHGNPYYLYSTDVCCGKALLIGKNDFKFTIKSLVDLRVSR